MDDNGVGKELLSGAHVLASQGLVTGFGHVSTRIADDRFIITPARPLGALSQIEELIEVSLENDIMPAGAPGEAWIHWSIYRKHASIVSVCRAQPEYAGIATIAGVPISPVYGHGAFLGEKVSVHDKVELIRSRELGDELADTLGEAKALVIRGTGAVTVGDSVGEAVALMWVLENNSRMNFLSRLVGSPQILSREEIFSWSSLRAEMLDRVWEYLWQNLEITDGRV